MGVLVGKSLMVEGYFARLMYRSLYKMHQRALHGATKTALASFGRLLPPHGAAGEAALRRGDQKPCRDRGPPPAAAPSTAIGAAGGEDLAARQGHGQVSGCGPIIAFSRASDRP